MASNFPLRELYDQVTAWFAAQGDPCEHFFGSRALVQHRNANSYVWMPKSTQRSNAEATRGVDKHRVNVGAEHVLELSCWGADHEHAFLMAENALHAIRELGRADVSFRTAEWLDFEEDGQTELGNVYVLELSLGAAFVRRYTPIAAYAGSAPSSPTAPTVPTTEIQSVTVEVHATESVNQDGTVMGSDAANDEFSSEFSDEFQF